MENCIRLIKKPIWVKIEEGEISKRNCILSMIFCVVQLLYTCICLVVLKKSYLYSAFESRTMSIVQQLVLAAIIVIPTFVALFILLYFTKQDFKSIGFRKNGLKSSMYIGTLLLSIFFIKHLMKNSFGSELYFNTIFYLIFVGLFEEILFRGFMWPRLQLLFGKYIGFVICGLLFGVWHTPLQIIWNNFSIYDVFIRGASTNASVLSGLTGHLLFGYIYTRNNNILLPSFIHGFLDLSSF